MEYDKKIDTTFINRCIQTLEKAFKQLQQVEKDSLDYDLHRSATINEFERLVKESNIPILIQIFDWATLPTSFHKNILKKYEILFSNIS